MGASRCQNCLSHCETQPNQVSCKTYLDDRSCTARSAIKLHDVYDAWSQWSHSVGLVENLAKCVVSAAGKRKTAEASEVFDPSKVSAAVRVLGAVSCSVRRALHSDEVSRLESARKCARLLGCCGFSLDVQLRYLRQFLLSKVNFGWVGRSPTWSISKKLWSCFWSSVRRCRYTSPWLRSLFLGGNLHLDVTWATRLLSAVFRFRLSKSRGPSWSWASGTASNALRSWMKYKGFVEVAGRPWVWRHAFAAVTDASVNPSRQNLDTLTSLVLPVMLVGRVGGLGFSKNGMLLGVTRLLLFLSSLLRSFAPFVLMTCALGCSLLRLLLLLVLVALFLLLPGLVSVFRRPPLSVLGAVNLKAFGITLLGLAIFVPLMPLLNQVAPF